MLPRFPDTAPGIDTPLLASVFSGPSSLSLPRQKESIRRHNLRTRIVAVGISVHKIQAIRYGLTQTVSSPPCNLTEPPPDTAIRGRSPYKPNFTAKPTTHQNENRSPIRSTTNLYIVPERHIILPTKGGWITCNPRPFSSPFSCDPSGKETMSEQEGFFYQKICRLPSQT